MNEARRPSRAPVLVALAGGTAAVGIGLAVMQAGGAPRHYLFVNALAQAIGLALAAALAFVPQRAEGWLARAGALAMLATALWGAQVDGIQRWVSLLGVLQVQPAFILVPVLLCSYARCPDQRAHADALCVAGLAIALMPDRSMAMALCMVGFAVWLADRTTSAALVLLAGVLALIVTIVQADTLAGVPFVEHVLRDGWRADAGQGAALTIGALAMLAPVLATARLPVVQQRATVAFVLCWAMLLAASLAGAYPTPLLGYAPSAVLGYFMSVVALRSRRSVAPV